MALITAGDQLFSLPLAEDEERFEVQMSKDQVWERYNTLSHISRLEGKEREVSDVEQSFRGLTETS